MLGGSGRGKGRLSSQGAQDTHELPRDRAVQHDLEDHGMSHDRSHDTTFRSCDIT